MIGQDRKRSRQWNRRILKGRNLRFCRHKSECKDQLIAKAQVRRRTVKEGYVVHEIFAKHAILVTKEKA